MKKTFLVLLIVAGTFASCKKNYTCECTTETTWNGNVSTTVSEFSIEEASKSQAEDACIEATVVNESDNYKSEETCELSTN